MEKTVYNQGLATYPLFLQTNEKTVKAFYHSYNSSRTRMRIDGDLPAVYQFGYIYQLN